MKFNPVNDLEHEAVMHRETGANNLIFFMKETLSLREKIDRVIDYISKDSSWSVIRRMKRATTARAAGVMYHHGLDDFKAAVIRK